MKSKILQAVCLSALAIVPARADEKSSILADSPKAYYRFNDDSSRDIINYNIGSLGSAGNAVHDLATITGGVVHSIPGAIVGDSDRASFFDYTTRTEIPFDPGVNPPATQPFSMEAWLLPSTDQVGLGMGALANRWTQGGARQGWVLYQRAADTNHCTSCGPGLGWEFRMYNGVDSSTHLDVISGVPFALGQWQHVAVVYDPVGGDPTHGQLVIYINGVAAATNINTSATPGYGACTGDHDPAPNGQPALSIGGYNNANSGTAGFANPWFGGADEFALYASKLTSAQILAHYQNGTNAQRSQSYQALVQGDHPVVYLRLNEIAPTADLANNSGDARSAGIGTHSAGVKHPAASALAGRKAGSGASYHLRNGNTTTDIPFQANLNPNAGVPFTFETWLRPTNDRQNPGAAPVNNRYVSSGNRTGWVIFQRAPDINYTGVSGYSGVGWNFRMFTGAGGSGQDVTTGVSYKMDEWQHFVVTWEPYQENGDVLGNGNDQWVGVLTAYFNGVPVATNSAAKYSANTQTTEDGSPASDLAVGGYNAASGLGANPFEGDVDQLAIYNNLVLSTNQILAHYQAGTNANNNAPNYANLVYSAGVGSVTNNNGQTTERVTLPALYLQFNDSAYFGAVNNGTLGALADGSLINTTNIANGPQSPAFAGFTATNAALSLDGTSQFASLNNPAGLNISGQITLEAWVQPAATLPGAVARIISHGPETVTVYPVGHVNAVTNTSEVYLRLDGNGANYSVGSAQYSLATGNTDTHQATVPVPAEDLTGSAWVHLVGTYDGSAWNLYRNGVLLASQASAVGAVPVAVGDWAVGATGQGWGDNFAGNIGDVAIYDKALTGAQVAGHYAAAKVGTSGITITPAPGGKVTVTWPAGTTLQSATKVSGPYTNVTGSPVSPLTVSATAAKFYRWVLQ